MEGYARAQRAHTSWMVEQSPRMMEVAQTLAGKRKRAALIVKSFIHQEAEAAFRALKLRVCSEQGWQPRQLQHDGLVVEGPSTVAEAKSAAREMAMAIGRHLRLKVAVEAAVPTEAGVAPPLMVD